MANERVNRTADGAGKRSNEDIYTLLYQLNRRVEELSALVAGLKRQSEGSENQ